MNPGARIPSVLWQFATRYHKSIKIWCIKSLEELDAWPPLAKKIHLMVTLIHIFRIFELSCRSLHAHSHYMVCFARRLKFFFTWPCELRKLCPTLCTYVAGDTDIISKVTEKMIHGFIPWHVSYTVTNWTVSFNCVTNGVAILTHFTPQNRPHTMAVTVYYVYIYNTHHI